MVKQEKRLLTIEDAVALGGEDGLWELVEGELIEMVPPGGPHGRIENRVAYYVTDYVLPRSLGEVFTGDTGFILRRKPDTLRGPDVAFVAKERLPAKLAPGFLELAPDLVVEVVSPSDWAAYVQRKVQMWLDAGVRLVWVIYPDTETVMVHRTQREALLLRRGDTLDGEPVLPGFSLRVEQIFD